MQNDLVRILAVALFTLFWGVEYRNWFSVEAIAPHSIYYFELIWVAAVWIFFRKIKFFGKIAKTQKILLAILLPLGWLAHFLLRMQGVAIPFDFAQTETILFLLFFAPILEELIFRGAIWRLIEVWSSHPILLTLITSVLFSYAQYQAIGGIPDEYKLFVYHQTFYAFVLSLFCARLRIRSGLWAAILGHAVFNFGFWLVAHS